MRALSGFSITCEALRSENRGCRHCMSDFQGSCRFAGLREFLLPSGRSEQHATTPNNLPTLLVLTGLILGKGRGSSGFASLAYAHSAHPHCPRQRTRYILKRGGSLIGSGNVVGRRPLGASSSPQHLCVARPGLRPSGAYFHWRIILDTIKLTQMKKSQSKIIQY